jgi:signal transduction histidine kinase
MSAGRVRQARRKSLDHSADMTDTLSRPSDPPPQRLTFLVGGGEVGAYIRAHDWSQNPMGVPETWPAALRTALRILLNTDHPVFLYWGESLTCFYNDAFARSLGPEQHPGMLGSPAREAWRELWPIIEPQIALVMRGEGATWHENQLVPLTRHGKVEAAYWTYSYGPIHDDFTPTGVGGVLVLVTETTPQVLAANRERDDAENLRMIFEQSPAFMAVLRGPEHRIEYTNARFLELVGRAGIAPGTRMVDALPEVVAQGYIALLDAVFTTGTMYSATAARVMLAGVERAVDFLYQPLRADDGTITGILVQGTDVTERETVQARLNLSAARLQLATDAADIGIYEFDLRTGDVFWDERVRRLWALGPDESATFERFIAGVVASDRTTLQAAVDRAMQPDQGGHFEAEYRLLEPFGAMRWVRSTGRVTFAGDIPVRFIGTVQDVTPQKLDQLALEEADRQKDVFLATLSHELRNPLAPICSAAQLLALPGVGPAEVQWVHDVITRQSQHMSSLLEDLLDVARLSQGRMVLTPEPLDIRTVLDAAIETVQPALAAKQHSLHVDVPQGALTVSGDAIRLCQVFTNLLSNAIKYMAVGGAIDLVAEREGDRAVISVRDQGDGMAPDTLSDVFGMFRQSVQTLERAEGGLGIGLALVRAIVNLHDGSVHAMSEGFGLGSTFVVELPLHVVPTAMPAAPVHAPATVQAPARRVLIVDDNVDSGDTLAMLLTMQGHTVQTARDGAEALRVAERFQPDVLLVDIGMPVMNGYDMARTIRDRGILRGARLVALTGWGQEDDRERAFAAGFHAHMTKPPDLARLLEQLAS